MQKTFAAAALAAALSAAMPAVAHEYKAGDITIGHPWTRMSPGPNGAGYMTLANGGSEADRLVAAETAAAAKSQIHRSVTEGGVSRMLHQENGVVIPAGESVTFAPGGYHVMLIGLKAPIRMGDRVPLTLVFERAGRVDVELSVAMKPAGDGHGDGHAGH